ncbi:MAG: hypothetical protein M1812_003733 [Candelaria pacifica]|nr:MAG: hypothetical protein M1812_003733 [Candelaria pacifica]
MPPTTDTHHKYDHYNLTFPQEYVAHVEINRPSKMNAFIEPMWLELRQIFDTLSHSSHIRAIVLSGAGDKAFTTGLDVQAASQSGALAEPSGVPLDGARKAWGLRRHIAEFQDCISSVENCEKPVVCVLHGYTFGLGIDLSTCADIRICATSTKLSVKEVDIGIAADIGTLTRLPKAVGSYSWVKDVCLTARVWDAEEALKVGFVSGVYKDKSETLSEGFKIAATMAAKSPVAVQGTKHLLDWSRDHSVADGLKYTGVWNSSALATDDVQKSMLAGIQKKTPRFEKL